MQKQSSAEMDIDDAFAARFHHLTGLVARTAWAGALPESFLSATAPSPEAILAYHTVGKRTANALRREIAARGGGGQWTYQRLLAIPGFGLWTLLDVLEAAHAANQLKEAIPNRTLREEIAVVMRGTPGATPHLLQVIDLIRRQLPISETQVYDILQGRGFGGDLPTLVELERAARFTRQPIPFAVLRREELAVAVPASKLALARKLYEAAVRFLRSRAVARVNQLALQVGCDDLSFAERLLSARTNFRWLDRRAGWFWFRNESLSLCRNIDKVLSVAPSLSISDLGRSMFRWWPPDHIPPLSVLRELCSQLPHVEIVGQSVRAQQPVATRLEESDHRTLGIFRAWGPQIVGAQMGAVSARLGLPLEQLRVLLRSSVLVLEPTPGVFQLVGT